MRRGIDPAYSMDMPKPQDGIGHSILRPAQSLTDLNTPIVPVLINCYYAPQPTAARCYQVGRAAREIIDEYPDGLRVAVVGSGGLWHTPQKPGAWLNEAFDDELLARILLGWARACQGEIEEGVRGVEQGLALAKASGAIGGLPLLYIAAAHVYRMAQRRERAEGLIDLAETEYRRTGEDTFHIEACVARAQVRLGLGDGALAEVERLLLEGLEIAGTVGSLQRELIISTHLARLAPRTGKLREAHDRLARHYARLSEGLDRGPAREAKAALDELAARLGAGTPAASKV